MHKVLGAIDAVSRFAGLVAVLLVTGIVTLIIIEIMCRTLFNLSLSFAWEYSAYFLGVSIFFGAAFTLRTGGHVRVAFLTASSRPLVARTVEYVATIFGVGVTGFLAVSLILFAWQTFVTGSTSPTIDAVPLVIPTTGMAVGATLLALQMMARLVRLLIRAETEDREAMRSYSVE